jgi:hypothetical protein
VAKLSPTLPVSWTRYLSGRNNAKDAGVGNAVAVDATGHVYTTGWFQGTFDFDPGPGTDSIQSGNGGGWFDLYVSELDGGGNFVAAADYHALSGGGNNISFGIAVDNSSPGSPNVYTTG